MRINLFTLIIFLFTQFSAVNAQENDFIKGELIVKLYHKAEPNEFLATLNQDWRSAAPQFSKTLSKSMNIYLLTFDDQIIGTKQMLMHCQNDKRVELVQVNRKAKIRNTTPNDPDYIEQWNMDIIGAPEVWDITTGGTTIDGQEIVIAVLDDGFDLNHPDFANTYWYNEGEIADDGIDNDGNGFIDDFVGWNTDTETDNHPGDNHGTFVAGIAGAKGNNDEGVTGVNWDMKILVISKANQSDEIIQSYAYIRDFRKLYNDTNGEKGAFIVVTNSSFGINNVFCTDQPIWGAMYDSLGVVGVLSTGATTNANVDVDANGDMPTSCTSEYLISVTNTDRTDTKVTSSGYGTMSIDIGAPGEDVYSTINNGAFGFAGDGTSFSTPHVTGAVALMYSMPCTAILDQAKLNPAQAAASVRDIIYDGATPLVSLENITTTGGRLDLAGSMNILRKICGGSEGKLGFCSVTPNPTDGLVNINLQTPQLANYSFRIFDAAGRLVKEETLMPNDYFAGAFTLDLSLLKPGVYMISVSTRSENTTHKLVIH